MIYFIVNRKARTGNGYANWAMIRRILKKENVAYRAWLTKYAGHAQKLAQEISNLPEDIIFLVVLGGDGTLNEVVNGIKDFRKVCLGVLPTGSGNDFVRGMGLTRNPVYGLRRILDIVRKQEATGRIEAIPTDLGYVVWDSGREHRYYTISSGIGLDALVCKEVDTSKFKKILNAFRIGKLTYLVLTVKLLFGMKTAACRISMDGQEYEYRRLIFLAGLNLPAEGGGVKMAPHAVCDDGYINLCAAHDIPKWKTFLLLPFVALGKHAGFKGFSVRTFQNMKIRLSEPMTIHTDGEYCGESDEVTLSCAEEQLLVLNTR